MSGMPFVFGEPPEEVKQAIRAAREQNEMVGQAMRHEAYRALSERTTEELSTFGHLFHHMDGDLANFWEGFVSGLLLSRGHCPGCGVNHEEELLKGVDHPNHPHAAEMDCSDTCDNTPPDEWPVIRAGMRVISAKGAHMGTDHWGTVLDIDGEQMAEVVWSDNPGGRDFVHVAHLREVPTGLHEVPPPNDTQELALADIRPGVKVELNAAADRNNVGYGTVDSINPTSPEALVVWDSGQTAEWVPLAHLKVVVL